MQNILLEVLAILLVVLSIPFAISYVVAVLTGSNIVGFLLFVVMVIILFYDPDKSNKGEKDD